MGGEYKLHIHINAHCERYVQHAGFQLAYSAMHSMLVNTSSVVIKFYNLYAFDCCILGDYTCFALFIVLH